MATVTNPLRLANEASTFLWTRPTRAQRTFSAVSALCWLGGLGYFFTYVYRVYCTQQLLSIAELDRADVPDMIALWTEAFLASIAIELVFALCQGKRLYSASDATTSINTGLLVRVVSRLVGQANLRLLFTAIRQHGWYLTTLRGPTGFVAAFLAADLTYYWFHRLGHTTALGWALHGQHHSSEYYNYSTALRQSAFHGMVARPLLESWWAFFFDPTTFYLLDMFNILFQFWIHTSTIDKLPSVYEFFFNSPSQHRVHHARNAQYIDKNYAGTLALFDRVFGTYREEDLADPPIYGLTHSINTFNAVSTNMMPLSKLVRKAYNAPTVIDGLRVFWQPPGWVVGTDKFHDPPRVSFDTVQRYDPQLSSQLHAYQLVQLVATIFIHSAYEKGAFFTLPAQTAGFVDMFICLSIYALGLLGDRSPSFFFLEPIRLCVGIIYVLLFPPHGARLALTFLSMSLVFVFTAQRLTKFRPLQTSEIGAIIEGEPVKQE